MAKKTSKTPTQPSDNTSPAPRRRAASRKSAPDAAAAPIDIASLTPIEPLSTADDRERLAPASSVAVAEPSFDDIAQEAYRRYLDRGAGDGRDFDDWIEAERELSRRRRT